MESGHLFMTLIHSLGDVAKKTGQFEQLPAWFVFSVVIALCISGTIGMTKWIKSRPFRDMRDISDYRSNKRDVFRMLKLSALIIIAPFVLIWIFKVIYNLFG